MSNHPINTEKAVNNKVLFESDICAAFKDNLDQNEVHSSINDNPIQIITKTNINIVHGSISILPNPMWT